MLQPKIHQKIYAQYFLWALFIQAASFLMVHLIIRQVIEQDNLSPRFPGIDLKEFK